MNFLLDFSDKATSSVLRQVRIPIFTWDRCQEFSLYYEKVDSGQVCAGNPDGGGGPCFGDSGGPLVCKATDGTWQLIGLTSYGDASGDNLCDQMPDPYVVFTRIQNYKQWILTNIARSKQIASLLKTWYNYYLVFCPRRLVCPFGGKLKKLWLTVTGKKLTSMARPLIRFEN